VSEGEIFKNYVMREIWLLLFYIGLSYHSKSQELFTKHEFADTYAFSITDSLPENVSFIVSSVLNKYGFKSDTIKCLPNCKNPFHINKTDFDSYFYKRGTDFAQVYFSKKIIAFSQDTTIETYNNTLNVVPNKPYHSYGFSLISANRKKVEQNMAKVFLSSLNQALSIDYALSPENFISIQQKSNKIFWKRTMLNMAYGVAYIKKQNPFANNRNALTVTLAIIESVYYYPIFVGPFVANSRQDKIFSSVFGISSLLIFKTITGLIGTAEIKRHNRILEAGYKIPRTVVF
jgi:hypothetical protein